MSGIRVHLTPDQLCAVNNALRREIEIQQRLSGGAMIGVSEYIRHLEDALGVVTAGWDKAFGFRTGPT